MMGPVSLRFLKRPESVFSPPPGATNEAIKVTVEALRGGVPIQSAYYTITVSPKTTTPEDSVASEHPPAGPPEPSVSGPVAIEITKIPRYDPTGGPDTRDDIAGVVRGVANLQAYRVVL